MYCANFISDTEGFAASKFGDVIHTTNGGNTWVETTPVSSYELDGIYFANSSTGWVSGEYLGVPHVASISKTTDGGNTWETQSFGTDEYIQDIYFVDELSGWAVGGSFGGSGTSTILHTTTVEKAGFRKYSPTTNALYGLSFVDGNHGWAVGFGGTTITYTNPVPVELSSFSASVSGSDVQLNWLTATETNNSGFEIQRSDVRDQKSETFDWEKIGFVEGRGTSTEKNNYSFVDKNLETGKYSYRLVQIDFNGTRTESKIVNIEIKFLPTEYSLFRIIQTRLIRQQQ